MIGYKNVTKVIAAFTAAAVFLSFFAILVSPQTSGIAMDYESELFGDGIIKINIVMDESEFSEMLDNAISEEYYACDVEINGETFYRVGIRPKGNTSLSTVFNDPDTDRYSFKIEFDHYVDGQTCFGLDKLVLNNNYADATNMKEALVYDLYAYVGADASLWNYAEISVNGEYRGVYLALEAVEDSFLLRNYGTTVGNLYKPEGVNSEGDGADLNYSNSEIDSYSAIWEGASSSVSSADKKRVVSALKNVSEGTDLEKYADVDNLLRYAAVHIFSVNSDSLSGNMAHNYYLYESGGKLNLLPWDYNLAFGGMGGSAESVVNDAIDCAFDGTDFFDALTEQYHDLYFSYMEKIVDYVNNGRLDEFLEKIHEKIDGLVETDPTAFYSYDEYLEATETLEEVVKLRAESVGGQICGDIPSTASEQINSTALVSAEGIDIGKMGEMSTGENKGEDGGRFENFGEKPNQPSEGEMPNFPTDGEQPEMPNFPTDGEKTEMPDFSDEGERPTEVKPDGAIQRPDADVDTTAPIGTLLLYGGAFAVFAFAFLFAVFFRRRPKK